LERRKKYCPKIIFLLYFKISNHDFPYPFMNLVPYLPLSQNFSYFVTLYKS
jgi:hypothetical protein